MTGSSGYDISVITVSLNEEPTSVLWLHPRSCHPLDHTAASLVLACLGRLVILKSLGPRSRRWVIVGSQAFCQRPLLVSACGGSSPGGLMSGPVMTTGAPLWGRGGDSRTKLVVPLS